MDILDEQTKKSIRDSYPREQIEEWEREAALGDAEAQKSSLEVIII